MFEKWPFVLIDEHAFQNNVGFPQILAVLSLFSFCIENFPSKKNLHFLYRQKKFHSQLTNNAGKKTVANELAVILFSSCSFAVE